MLIFDNVLANYMSNNWCSKPVCETNPPNKQNLIVSLITGGQWLCFWTQWSVPGGVVCWLPLWIKLFSNVIKNMQCQLQVKLSIGKSAEAYNTWESNTLNPAFSFLGVPSSLVKSIEARWMRSKLWQEVRFPNLCFPHNVSSPLCNHTPVQRKTILDNPELNLDFSCVSVWGEQSIPDKCHRSVCLLCDSQILGPGPEPGSPPLPPVLGVCLGAWNYICLQLLACQGGKTSY